jgi:hypothetical protein
MAAIPINLVIEQGTDFNATFNIQNESNTTPLNLTGYTAVARLKTSYYSQNFISFNVNFVDRFNGIIEIILPNTATSNLENRRYVYSVILTSPQGKKSRVIEGIAEVTPGT